MRHHCWIDGLCINFTDVRDDCERQVSGPVPDNRLFGLFDQVLDFVLFLFVTADELLLLPGPTFRDISDEL